MYIKFEEKFLQKWILVAVHILYGYVDSSEPQRVKRPCLVQLHVTLGQGVVSSTRQPPHQGMVPQLWVN